jgi:hypothetical protein
LHHVEDSIRRFVERELISLLAESPAWSDVPLQIREVDIGCHQFTIDLWHGDPMYEPLRLAFFDRGGWLLASFSQRGWLNAQDQSRQRSFALAFEGLCKYAGVDLLWDQVVAELDRAWWWYDMNSDGIQIWPERGDPTTVLVKLRDTGAAAALTPPPREILVPPRKQLLRILFAKSPIYWREWVAAWDPPPEFPESPMPDRPHMKERSSIGER